MQEKSVEQQLNEIVSEFGLRDLSELKTYCQCRLKFRDSSMLSEYIKGFTISQIIEELETLGIMTFPEYLKETPRTLNDLGSDLSNEMHMVLGLVTEAGEVADAYKRHIAYGTDLDLVNVSEELGGDTMWYASNWYKLTGMSIYKAMFANIKKLKIRYPVEEGFSNERATSRDLETERKSLEKNV